MLEIKFRVFGKYTFLSKVENFNTHFHTLKANFCSSVAFFPRDISVLNATISDFWSRLFV